MGIEFAVIAALLLAWAACRPRRGPSRLRFHGSGLLGAAGPAAPGPFGAAAPAPQASSYVIEGVAGWRLTFDFRGVLRPDGGFAGPMHGAFVRGRDRIHFVGERVAAAPGAPLELRYELTGGTGAWAGVRGQGRSVVTLLGDPFAAACEPVPLVETGGEWYVQSAKRRMPQRWVDRMAPLGHLARRPAGSLSKGEAA